MPKLTLHFEGRILKEFAVGPSMTIGRLPDNTVVIDNPAVSGHHARVFRDGDAVILEDLESTNGTYFNHEHVTRHALQHGDVVVVGKHQLVFDQEAACAEASVSSTALSGMGDTMYLDTSKHRTLLATLRTARADADRQAGLRPIWVPLASARVGVLRVVAGRTDRREYDLEAQTSLIGKSDTALVRLKGWFKPDVAVAIARSGDGYVLTALKGKTLINSRPLRGRHHLKEGDLLFVSGLMLEFSLKPSDGFPHADREAPVSRLMSSGERAATFRALT